MKGLLNLFVATLFFSSGLVFAQAKDTRSDTHAPGYLLAATSADPAHRTRPSGSGIMFRSAHPHRTPLTPSRTDRPQLAQCRWFCKKESPYPKAVPPLRGGGRQGTRQSTQSSRFAFRVCNKSLKRASVALSYRDDNNQWIVQGWWTVEGGDCRHIGRYRTGYFYYYAKEYSGKTEWNGNCKLCVQIPNKFKRINKAGFTCKERFLKKFIEKRIITNKYTWNLLN